MTRWTLSFRRPGEHLYRGLEHHDYPQDAYRAMMVCVAHDLKNGRKPDYLITPPLPEIPTVASLNLPSWAIEALKGWAY